MALKTRYVTVDEFKEYFGIDLRDELRTSANPSNEAEAFIVREENRMTAFLSAHFHKDVRKEFQKFDDFDKEHFKLAMLEQLYYVFRNGEISTDSGYDEERGETADKSTRERITIAPNAINELRACNLWDRRIKPRGIIFDTGWWKP